MSYVSRYDGYPPEQAIRLAWTIEGPAVGYHRQQVERLRREWPILARAIERLVTEIESFEAAADRAIAITKEDALSQEGLF